VVYNESQEPKKPSPEGRPLQNICPDIETLAEFCDGKLDKARAEQIESHLAGCPGCLRLISVFPLEPEKQIPESLKRRVTSRVLAELKAVSAPKPGPAYSRVLRRGMMTAIAACLILAVTLLLLEISAPQALAVEEVIGTPRVVRAGTGLVENVVRGTSLARGDSLITKAQDMVSISTGDCLAKLNSSTRVEIAGEPGQFRLIQGEMWLKAGSSNRPVHVQTDLGTFTISGTEIDLRAGRSAAVLLVVSGTVDCQIGQGKVVARKGDCVVAQPGGKTRVTKGANPKEAIAWTNWSAFRSDPQHTGAITGDLVLPREPLWEYNISFVERFEGGLVASKGILYAGSFGNRWQDSPLYAIGLKNGLPRILWSRLVGNVWNAPAASPVMLFLTATRGIGSMIALEASTGEEKWEFEAGTFVKSSPTLMKEFLFVADGDGNFHCLHAADGSVRWSTNLGYSVENSSPALSKTGVLFVGTTDGSLHAIDSATGARKWQAGVGYRIISSPVAYAGLVYVQVERDDGRGALVALKENSGEASWEIDLTESIECSPAVCDGRLYVPCGESGLKALDAASGAFLWQTGHGVFRSSPIVSPNVVIAVGEDEETGQFNIYTFNASGGKLISCCPAPPETYDIISAGGRVYSISQKGVLCSFGRKRNAQNASHIQVSRLHELIDIPREARHAAAVLGIISPESRATVAGTISRRQFERATPAGSVWGYRYYLTTDGGVFEIVSSTATDSQRCDPELDKLLGEKASVTGVRIPPESPLERWLLPEETEWLKKHRFERIVFLEIKTG